MAYYEALWLSAYSPLVCNSKVQKNINLKGKLNLIFIKVLVNKDYVYMHQLQISVCKM